MTLILHFKCDYSRTPLGLGQSSIFISSLNIRIVNDEILKYEPQLELGIPLLVSGYIENSDENIKLIVNSVNGNEAIKEIKNINLPLKINISRNITLNESKKLKKLFEKYPGDSIVEINLSNSGLKARIGIEDYKVENCDKLKEEIQEFNFSSY